MNEAIQKLWKNFESHKRNILNELDAFERHLRSLPESMVQHETLRKKRAYQANGFLEGMEFPKLTISQKALFDSHVRMILPKVEESMTKTQKVVISKTLNALMNNCVHTIGDLVKLDEEKMLEYRNIGSMSISLIKACLKENGLKLGMNLNT